jgi:hypothetical protein
MMRALAGLSTGEWQGIAEDKNKDAIDSLNV